MGKTSKALYTANQALTLASKVARVINSEVHSYVYAPGNQSVGTSPTILDLTAVTQGDQVNQRTGDSIKPTSLTIRGYIDSNTAGVNHQKVRLMIFQYKQENGTAPVVADLLESTTTPANLVSSKKADDKYDSKILYDKLFDLSMGHSHGSRVFTKVFKLAGHINFESGANDKENGGIYAMFVSNDNTNTPTLYFYSKLSFYDN